MYAQGAEKIIPAAGVEQALALKEKHPEYLLAGERKGIKLEGFDYGNSPSEIEHTDFTGKTVVHTTSAGVQGIALAEGADEIIVGALVNASAVAKYIRQKNPQQVSLVCMGWEGRLDTEEDDLCARFIASILGGNPIKDIQEQAYELRYQEGKKFFDPMRPQFPEDDFWLSTKVDAFDFIIRVTGGADGVYETEKVVLE